MNDILTLILFLLIIGILVFVHEFGHFAAAKLTRVPVNEFAIGFGPRLFEKDFKGTKYQLRLIPLGGFVSLEGEEDSNSPNGFRNQRYLVKVMILLGGIFMNIVLAIFVLFIYMQITGSKLMLPNLSDHTFSNVSKSEKYYPVGIRAIEEENYGWSNIEPGEVIVEIDGKKTESLDDIETLIDQSYGETVELTFLDIEETEIYKKDVVVGGLYKGEYLPLVITDIFEDSEIKDEFNINDVIISIDDTSFKSVDEFLELLEDSQGKEVNFGFLDFETGEIDTKDIKVPTKTEEDEGILKLQFYPENGVVATEVIDVVENEYTYYEFNNSILTPVTLAYDLTIFQIDGIAGLLGDAFSSGDFSDVGQSVGSPVAVRETVSQIVVVGNFNFLLFLGALISLSLAMFNILPIPALDGGQVALVTVEKIRRKKFSEDTVQKINTTGFIFLMSLSVLLIAKDIVQFDVVGDIFNGIEGVLGR